MENKQEDKKTTKTMSVPELRRILGLKKTESYWLVHRNYFKSIIVNEKIRVDIDSFEEWYSRQVKYKKVNGELPGLELKRNSYSFQEAANLLGIFNATLYEVWKSQNLPYIVVDNVRRIPKDEFEAWYENQDTFAKVSIVLKEENLEKDYIRLNKAAKKMGLTVGELSYITRNGEDKDLFKVLIFNNHAWISKEGIKKYYAVLRKKRNSSQKAIVTNNEYITCKEACELADVSRNLVSYWIKKQCFTCVKVGKYFRINKSEFLEWLEQYEKKHRDNL